ncbi:MAG TPA: class I SAM-dependent methyltransferase [Pyrinomonadaceae bacterium]|nr:class I SAM-dependent methyltransferase [Pyrinomonadaceae bacterium]
MILGSGISGNGIEPLLESDFVEIVETDVAFGPRTCLICDAHDIPFPNNSFDAIIVQAVLEHVVDPYRCADEIHRVLGDKGLVFADTPFMQQVHMREYDFTRFTFLGHRRLFRRFEEISSGISCGPGMALAWSFQYFLLSFTTSLLLRKFLVFFAGLTTFFLKYFDHYLIRKVGSLDAASSYYFIGRKGNETLSDRELLKQYRGAF